MVGRKTTRKEVVPPVQQIATTLARMPTVPQFVRECHFAPGRGWAFDIGWPSLKVAVEYEGNTWVTGASRHTTSAGYRSDIDKYNTAAYLGWCIIRVTADMVKSLAYLEPVLAALYIRMDDGGTEELKPGLHAGDRANGKSFEELWAERQNGASE